MIITWVLNYGISTAAFLLLVAYHVYLYISIHRYPLRTSQGMVRRVRELWVRSVMDERKDILAVQTLRNWTMAATFLASTAIIIGLGIFNLAVTADKQGELSTLLNLVGNDTPGLWTFKLVLLGANFLFAFFNFILAVRYFNHTGFMICLPSEAHAEFTVETVIAVLARGAMHYTLGMRGYYLSIPLLLWVFGPLWLMAGTILLMLVLYQADRGISEEQQGS